jgi:hypothetical protein
MNGRSPPPPAAARLVEFALTRPDGEQGAANLLAKSSRARSLARKREAIWATL